MIIRLTPVYQQLLWKKYLVGYKFQKWVKDHWEDYEKD